MNNEYTTPNTEPATTPEEPQTARRAPAVIITGGGTGGHVYPAIAIANALRKRFPDARILFVGANGRLEMKKVPEAGYEVIGLPIIGIFRTKRWKNVVIPYKMWRCGWKAGRIVKAFKPDVVVGVGGYGSAPVLWVAHRRKIPIVLQEQNSFAGLTNKLLAKRAAAICVAYDGMERFFPEEKIVLTGNPVRYTERLAKSGWSAKRDRETDEERAAAIPNPPPPEPSPTILILGGSLGARTINDVVEMALPTLRESGIHFIWQTGEAYFERAKAAVESLPNLLFGTRFSVVPFICRMDEAYAAADIVISRAGAGTISELCVAAKACVFVPSPNVAEDHQTKNAQALVNKNAAIMVRDDEAGTKLWDVTTDTLRNKKLLNELETNIAALAKPCAADEIVDVIMKIFKKP